MTALHIQPRFQRQGFEPTRLKRKRKRVQELYNTYFMGMNLALVLAVFLNIG